MAVTIASAHGVGQYVLQLVTIGEGCETIGVSLLHPRKTRPIGASRSNARASAGLSYGDWLRNDVKRSGSTVQGNPEVVGSLDRFETTPVAFFRRAFIGKVGECDDSKNRIIS
jgi:hypothetical protein